jgi:3-hydroxybutyrate dehydrogenase
LTRTKKQVAIVTGAASGIGRAIAKELAGEGKSVVVVDLDQSGGTKVAQEIGGIFIKANLTRKEDCRNVVEETLRRCGTVHILVNDAGFQHVEPIETFPESTWDDMIAVMMTAPFLLTKYCWPTMATQKYGRIVNIASTQGLVATPYKTPYVTAKHGLVGFTKGAALEGGPLGITVNAIAPAYVRTPLMENQIKDLSRTMKIPESEVIEKVMLEPAAIKRLVEPQEVASLVSYLCSNKASAVTGSCWTIDLGWTAR